VVAVSLKKVLQRVRSEGKSILLNSHLLSEVEAVADRVAILSRGKVVRVSTVDALTSRASQYEVEADIGSHVIKIPPDVGKIISVSTKGLIAELTDQENINHIIDELRLKRITIRSVRPLKITLEQSFLETITATTEEAV
jgi:ABC-2 type transport system ATP-binding protein